MRTPRIPVFGAITSVLLLAASTSHAQGWREQAEADIREHRTAPLRIRVENADDAGPFTLRVAQRSTPFNWGTVVRVDQAASRSPAEDGRFVPTDPYHLHFLEFNSVTPGNAGKWKLWERASYRRNYLRFAGALDSLGIRNRGHGTVWPSINRWNAVPQDVVDITDSLGADGEVLVTKNERIRRRVRAHIEDNVRALVDIGVYELDLINELVHVPDLTRNIMGLDREQRIAEHTQWYQWAKAAAPSIRLVANEYDLFQSGNDFHEDFVAYVGEMLAAGAPIDAVGMQGHFFGTVPDHAELRRRLDEVAVLGLPMSITEFDMTGESADEIERALHAAFAHPLVYGFTVWGAWDGQQWRGNAPIYYRDWSLKPNGERYFELVQGAWRTEFGVSTSTTDTTVQAFHGNYDVFVELGDRLALAEVSLGADGAEVVVDLAGATTLPAPEILIEGDPETVFPNQPVVASVDTAGGVTRVVYRDGERIVGLGDGLGVLRFGESLAGTLALTAEVTYASGYRVRTPVRELTVLGSNTAPLIGLVLPESGSSFLVRDSILVQATGSDADGDELVARLVAADGTLAASDSSSPFTFYLDGLPVGSNAFTLELDDGNFAVARRDYVVRVFDDSSSIEAAVQTLGADDDVDQREDGSIDATGDIDLGEKLAGLRFLPGIPADASIDSAYVQFVNQKDAQTGPNAFTIHAEAAANPGSFTRTAGNVSARELTEESVTWFITEPWRDIGEAGFAQRTPDLSPLLQALVERDGFTAGSGVNLIFGIGDPDTKRSAYAVDQRAELAPTLTVYYTAEDIQRQIAAPLSLAFAQVGQSGGTLTWQDPNDPLGEDYEVRLADEAEPRLAANPRLDFGGLVEGETYTARVRALGRYGVRSAFSEPLSFSLQTSGSGARDVERLAAYPNPATDQLTVVLPRELGDRARARVFGVDGALHFEVDLATGGAQRLDLAGLPAGHYTVRVLSAGGAVYVAPFVRR